MSIAGGTDLLAEVIGRAEPVRQQQVLNRLEAIGRPGQVRIEQANASPSGSSPSQFADLVAPGEQLVTRSRTNFNLAVAPDSSRSFEAAREFEKFLLSHFLKAIMPGSGADGIQGSDLLAQDMAHSQMANAMASELSQQAGFGIAKQLAAARPELQQYSTIQMFSPATAIPTLALAEPEEAYTAAEPVVPAALGAGAKAPMVTTLPTAENHVAASPMTANSGALKSSPVTAVLSAIEEFFKSIGGTGLASDRLRSLR